MPDPQIDLFQNSFFKTIYGTPTDIILCDLPPYIIPVMIFYVVFLPRYYIENSFVNYRIITQILLQIY